MNYCKYRLNDDKELAKYQKDLTRYNRFVNRVYNFLDGIMPGESVVVEEITDDRSIDLFIKVVCLYILYMNPRAPEESYIIFSTDYTVIKREKGLPKQNRYHNNFYND